MSLMLRWLFLFLALSVGAANAANTTLGNLSAGGAVAGTDLFYDVQTVGTGGVKVTAAQLKTYLQGALTCGAAGDVCFNGAGGLTGDTGLTYAGAGGVLTLTPAANTAQPLLITGGSTTGSGTSKLGTSVVGTLNTTGVVDGAAFFSNITNTASGAATTLFDFQLGGVSQIAFNAITTTLILNSALGNPSIQMNTPSGTNVLFASGGNGTFSFQNISTSASIPVAINALNPAGLLTLGATSLLGFTSNTFASAITQDTAFARNAAGVMEINNGTAATYTGTALKLANLINVGTAPVDGGGSCTATTFAGGASAGTFVAPTCAAGTIAITFAFTAPTGWACDAEDRTTLAKTLQQSATTATKATFTSTTSNADVVQYKCTAY